MVKPKNSFKKNKMILCSVRRCCFRVNHTYICEAESCDANCSIQYACHIVHIGFYMAVDRASIFVSFFVYRISFDRSLKADITKYRIDRNVTMCKPYAPAHRHNNIICS